MSEVVEVATEKDLDDFIRFPYSLYAHDPYYIPPLLPELRKQFSRKNPFFLHAKVRFFLARINGRQAGRIVSIVNHRHIEFHKERTGFFGFFESLNEQSVADALLNRVSEILKQEGIETLRGPMNFSTNEECGMLIEGFNLHPALMTPYNPPYYHHLMETHGMTKAKDLFAYICDIPQQLPEKVLRVAAIAEKSGITVRPVEKKRFADEMRIFQEVYNSAWEKNWGFIPLTDEELRYLADSLKPIVIPEMTLVAEKNNEPVGFLGILPDYNFVLKKMRGKVNPLTILKALYYAKRIKLMRLLLLGIKPHYRNRGVDALLFREGFRGSLKNGFRRVEFSWILEDNIPTQRLVEMIGGELYKKYRIYERKL
ncbi:MAG: GNAT family N-acetyltransferase [Nitrospirota bacterium]